MRIKEIQVDGFGAWTDLQLRELSEHLTVFYGPNEAGKTTLMQFVRGILYGYSPQRRRRYLPPVHGGEPGGALTIDSSSGRVRVTRRPGDESNGFGTLKVTDTNGKPRNAEVLPAMLSGVDEATYNNVFAVGLRELQELNTLDATEASQLLYNLTTGLDRVGLMEVMEQLQANRQKIVGDSSDNSGGSGNSGNSELETLLSQRRRLTDELLELETRNREWYDTVGELTTLKQQIEAQRRANERLESEIRTVDASLPIRQRWDDRELLKRELKAGDQKISVTPDALERLADLKTQIAQKQKQVKQLKQQRAKLKKEADTLGIDPRVTDHANQIESLTDQSSWMDSLEQQVRQLQPMLGLAPRPGEKLSLVSSLHSISAPLGGINSVMSSPLNTNNPVLSPQVTGGPSNEPQVTSRVLASLRSPARAVRDAAKRVKQAKAERERNEIQSEEVNERLASELLERRESSLKSAMDKAGALVGRLRRRIQVEERHDKMLRHRDELEADVERLIDEAVLPLTGLIYPGFLFAIGFAMLVTSIVFEDFRNTGQMVTALGIAAVFASVLWKVHLERRSQNELDGCNRQLLSLNDQIRQVEDERDELDRHIPAGGGSLDSRLTKAEQDLEHLQSLVPLDTDRQVAGQRGSGVDRKLELAEEALSEAHDRWRSALRRHKLPESLKPSEIRELAELTEEQQELERQKEAQRMELETRERELLGFWGRIDQLTQDLKLKAKEDDEPKDKLRLLSATLKEQRSLLSRKASMGSKYKKLGEELRRANSQGRRLTTARDALFVEMGVSNEEELRKLNERKREAAKLAQKIEEESARIEIELETYEGDAKRLRELVANVDRDTLEMNRRRLEGELSDGQGNLTRLHQRQGAVEQEVHSAGDDRRQDRLRLEIAGLNRKIGEIVRRWRVLNVSSSVLQKIRHDYENDRQPETLNVASQYLEKLTEGRYNRIWTPFGEAALRIDNQEGQSLPLDVLSAGTREAVFVCLRLALVSNFAARGASLPLVLDDVLVNFDVTRADAAASVLIDFASRGHQILLFTCHEHIMEAFAEAGAEIRVLPGRGAELLEERRRKRALLTVPEEVEEVEVVEEAEEIVEIPIEEEPAVEEVAVVVEQAPEVVIVADDDSEQDDIDDELEAEFFEEPEEIEEIVEVVDEEPDFFVWKSFWFDDDGIADFASLSSHEDDEPMDIPDEDELEPRYVESAEAADSDVWEAAAMWWDGDESPHPYAQNRPEGQEFPRRA